MRITKLGQVPEEKIFTGKCSYCKTEFECLRKEGTYNEDWRDGGGWLVVTCPNPKCGKSANAYERNDGSLVPAHKRPDLTWDGGLHSTEAQIADYERFDYQPR